MDKFVTGINPNLANPVASPIHIWVKYWKRNMSCSLNFCWRHIPKEVPEHWLKYLNILENLLGTFSRTECLQYQMQQDIANKIYHLLFYKFYKCSFMARRPLIWEWLILRLYHLLSMLFVIIEIRVHLKDLNTLQVETLIKDIDIIW